MKPTNNDRIDPPICWVDAIDRVSICASTKLSPHCDRSTNNDQSTKLVGGWIFGIETGCGELRESFESFEYGMCAIPRIGIFFFFKKKKTDFFLFFK